jgi:protein TonB
MTAIGGASMDIMRDRPSGDPVRGRHRLLSLVPAIALHGAVALIIWLGLTEEAQVQPPVTFISLAPAAAPAPEQAPPAPVVPAPEPKIEPDPLPLPETGMTLPQPEPPPPEPVLDFAPPALPELEPFPFDPHATRDAPPPEPEAVPIEKAAETPKPKEAEKPKPEKKEAKAKPKPSAKPKPKEEAKQAPLPAAAAPSARAAPMPAKSAAAAPAQPAPRATENAAISDAPVRVTNPNYAGACPISYPERARRRSQEGTVVIHALIGPDGKPIEVSVAQSSGHALLDEAAQEAIAQCTFVPQKVGGRAVKAIVEIPIPFKLI